ncbi:hypothetical protein CPB83DRAFT_943321 [Crepidotus variabilis]|uniref:Uncharacterized protein n=1 Tax=Crepidotus variabilis TaxID=179855 RepID=A0A9P6EAJ9_9AGAR|nr:hypothetical protein CPB83DRAFT_943321 [Crepidotus variabilis]
MSNARLVDLSGLKSSDLASLVSVQLEGMDTWDPIDRALTRLKPRNLSLFLAPNLRQIKISPATENISTYPLQWHQLTEIVLHHYPQSTVQIINLLRACLKMVRFRVLATSALLQEEQADLTLAQPSEECHPVSLTNLKTFEISTPVKGHHSEAFDNLIIPTIEMVTLKYLYTPDSPFFPDAEPTNDSPAAIHGTDAFLKMISVPDDNNEILCPRLEEFHSTTRDNQFTDQGILDFIKAKQAGIHQRWQSLNDLKYTCHDLKMIL